MSALTLDAVAQELEQIERLQSKMLPVSQKLAAALAAAPSARDQNTLRDLWQWIDQSKANFNTHYRNLRGFKPEPRNKISYQDFVAQRKLVNRLKLFKRRFHLWNTIDSLVKHHIDPQPIPLMPDRPASDNDQLVTLLYDALHKLANPNTQGESAEAYGCFPDIAMKIQLFEAMMQAAYRLLLVQGRAKHAHFLDVGCGGGTKVLAASQYFRQCDGLEYDPQYADAARRTLRLVEAENCQIYTGDGITYDEYHRYDVIYFYRPLTNDAQLEKMETQVMKNARPGTVVVAPYNTFLGTRSGFVGAKVTNPIFVAGMSQDDADTLRDEAEHTSTEFVRHSDDYAFDPGFWSPILDAASFNGTENVTGAIGDASGTLS